MSVDTERLSEGLHDALLSLLDDTSVAVRKALIAQFTSHGPVGAQFLQEIARGPNRVLAWHARWFLEELKFADPAAEFRGFIRSLNYELETGALLLSRTVSPNLDVGACCHALDEIAGRCRELIVEPSTAREKCRVINRVLFHERGFHGNVDHYTDPLNSFLDQVIARRTGIPISLSIVDTFDGGVFRTAEEIFSALRANNIVPKVTDLAPTPVREVLCRSCRCLVNHYQAAGDATQARLFAGFVEEFEATYERHASS
jgi:hypothetical protein